MSLRKLRRNARCQCGSGKKYKSCCLLKQKQARQAIPNVGLHDFVVEEDDLTELTNHTVDLIHDGKLDDAEHACEELRKRYPDVIDWIDRTAMLHEARGNFASAAEFYRMALAYTEQPDYADGFDDDGRQYYRDIIEKMDCRAAEA